MGDQEKLNRPPDEGPLDIYEGATREGLKAVLELFGFGTLGALLDRAIPTSFQRRVAAWLSDAQRAIRDLQRRVKDFEDLQRDPEFREFVADITAAAMRTHRQEKRDALRNVLVNAALPAGAKSRSIAKARTFLRFVDDLDVPHLLLLELMNDARAFLAKRNRPLPGPAANWMIEKDAGTWHQSPRSLLSIVSDVLRDDIPEDLHDIVMQDLVRRGLVGKDAEGHGFSTLCTGNSLASPLGQEFVRFIADPPEPAA